MRVHRSFFDVRAKKFTVPKTGRRLTLSASTAMKRRRTRRAVTSPIHFWGRIGIWSLFYLFAMAFPIGYAIQESNKQKTSEQD